AGLEEGLPPIFSLVFYNGDKAWDAPTRLQDCLSPHIPKSMQKYQPNIEYRLLDIGQIAVDDYNVNEDNMVSSLIALEKVGDPTQLDKIYDTLRKQLQGHQFDSLRRAFSVYINRVLKARKILPSDKFVDFSEDIMLSKQLEKW